MPNRVQVINEVSREWEEDKVALRFQWCQYVYENGTSEHGYRFIWSRDGRLLPSRGQARIPSIRILEQLVAQAKREGWGDYKDGE